MTKYNANVNNGIANIEIDTTQMTKGEYRIMAEYNQNNKYNSSTNNNGLLTLIRRNRITVDCTDNSQWDVYSDSWVKGTNTACNSTGVHSGTYRYVSYYEKIPIGSTINVHGTVTNNNRFILFVLTDSIPHTELLGVVKDVSSTNVYNHQTTFSTVSYGGSGEFNLQLTVGETNTTITINNETRTVPTPSTFLNGFYYNFRKWNTGEIVVDSMSIDLPNGGG